MNHQEEYNPEKHCCKYWYKDYCTCTKSYLKQHKKDSRDRNVNTTISQLNKNNITFSNSKINNVIEVMVGKTKIFISLKKEDQMVKYRIQGSTDWKVTKLNLLIKSIKEINETGREIKIKH